MAGRVRVVRVTAQQLPASTIDLGELGGAAAAGAPPRRSRLRRPGVAAALLVVLCLLTLGAASEPGPSLGRPLWTGQVSLAGFSLGAEYVFVSEPGAAWLAARAAGTGRVRWRLRLDEPLIDTVDLGGGSAALLTRTPGSNDETGRQITVRWVDGDGRVLAVHHGQLVGLTEPGRLGLIVMGTAGPACSGEPNACVDLVAVAPATGRAVWHLGPLRDGWFTVEDPEGRITTIATLGPTGSVLLRDPLTGDITATVSVPGLVADGPPQPVAGTLVALRRLTGRAELAGFWLDPLARAWELTLPLPQPPTEYNRLVYAESCGDMLCVHIDGGTTVVEPGRGTVRFRVPYDIVARLGGGQFLAIPPPSPRGFGPPERTVFVLDERSGARREELSGVTGMAWPGGHGRVLLKRAGRFTEFLILGADGRAERIGSVASPDLSCQVRGELLACSQASGLLQVWRLPP